MTLSQEMNALGVSISIWCVAGFSILLADTKEVPDSESLDHKYRVEVTSPVKSDVEMVSSISIVSTSDGVTTGSVTLGGYAKYPLNADPRNLAVLWAPSSNYLGLMIRDGKRSWTTAIYSVSKAGVSVVELPSAASIAFSLLGVDGGFRVVRERPSIWSGEDELTVRASGDATVDGKVIWYEADITYSISKRAVTNAKLISTKPHEA